MMELVANNVNFNVFVDVSISYSFDLLQITSVRSILIAGNFRIVKNISITS